MTTNNFTERMHKTVEARRSGTQTVVKFIEQLYGIKVFRKSLVQNELGETQLDAGLATYWNMRTIEHRQITPKKPVDKKCRINQERLYVLLGLVKQISEQQSYMLVEKQSKKFYSLYNFYPVNMSAKISEQINEMILKLINRDNLCVPTTHYLVNNKEHIIAPEKKNYIIHHGTSEDVYQEILRLFNSRGNDIFFPTERRTTIKDPFRLIENIQDPTTIGSSKNHGAKPRKSSQFFNSNNLQFNEAEKIYINENVDQEHNIFKHSVLSEISTSQNEDAIECTDSIQFVDVSSNEQENNNGSAIKDSLEELFLEKGCDWNLKDFTNMAVSKKLQLNDNPVVNGVKLYRWISNRKIREKKPISN
ncbi:proteophosphoglycan ppg4 [Gigaspora margarita]|uniref:Proteophosphoglycan ppg4 n=1 Tax=Gigaspora margarita TaxID=4874 RepID=A0A8H4B4K6_GIGMA|nr:proteophosphoglycan ppg4 [Gigaspora margarita]